MSQENLDYIYRDTNQENFQLVSEDIVNTLVNIQNQQNADDGSEPISLRSA